MEEEKEKNGRREEDGRIHCIDDQDMALLPISKCSWTLVDMLQYRGGKESARQGWFQNCLKFLCFRIARWTIEFHLVSPNNCK